MTTTLPVTIDSRFHDAVIFDLDGVVTDTASIHFTAWGKTFDTFLGRRHERAGEDLSPFSDADYRRLVDGKPRYDGVADFLEARGVSLPMGELSDDDDTSIRGVGNLKQNQFHELLKAGVPVFDSTVSLVRQLQKIGIGTAVFSSSRNCEEVLLSAGLGDLFEVRVDGVVAERLGLPGKPDPAVLLEATRRLDARPERTVVVEDAAAGVKAGSTGGFALVVGIDRSGHADELRHAGADAVVTDLAEVAVGPAYRRMSDLPDALREFTRIADTIGTRRPAIFLDFDGTVSSIVSDPDDAVLVTGADDALASLTTQCLVAVISGRDLADVTARVGLPGLWYAGSHGYELTEADGSYHRFEAAGRAVDDLDLVATELHGELGAIAGIVIEHKHFAIAVHYRNVATTDVDALLATAHTVGRRHGLRTNMGRKVLEIRPDFEWDKGTALQWILTLSPAVDRVVPICLGDDITDEDAFDSVQVDGIAIVVRHGDGDTRPTAAQFSLDSPAAVAQFLARLALHRETEDKAASDAWTFVHEGYDPDTEKRREVLCSIGNGYLSTRGCAPESSAGTNHYPGTYAAGVFNRLADHVAGAEVDNESSVNLPNWLSFEFRIGDDSWFDIDATTVLSQRYVHDLHRAILRRELRFRDSSGRISTVVQESFVSMHQAHVGALETTLTAENWNGSVEFRSVLDADVRNSLVARYRQLSTRHIETVSTRHVSDDSVLLEVRTNQTGIRIALAARVAVEGVDARYRPIDDDGRIGYRVTSDLGVGQSVTVAKVVTVYTSRDCALSEPAVEAERALDSLGPFSELRDHHAMAWSHLWDQAGIDLRGHADELRTLRLHILHLLQTVSSHNADLDAGVPARGLDGEAYRGHIFWDELFVFQVLNLRLPAITRTLLQYRYRRLPAARRAARAAGFRGAMFPWQSGSDGREESPALHLNPQSGHWNPDPSARQHHVGLAVAYNVWHYYQATDDRAYLIEYGAELLIEIARFWVSAAEFDNDLGRYVIRGVIGPDEFHSGYPHAPYGGIDNNAYTNIMSVWVILRATEALELLPTPNRLELMETLGLQGPELAHWARVSRRMFVPFHDGVISQFQGYEKLHELDWTHYAEKYGNIGRLDRILEAEGDDVTRYQVSKQADTLMLLYLMSSDELREVLHGLRYDFAPEQIPATVDYYLARTSHGSTLSAVVHSWVLARADREKSADFFRQVLSSDISDIQGGTTPEGIHLAAMAGSVDLIQRCFTGLETRGDRIVLSPAWPQELGTLAFPILYRGRRLQFRVDGTSITVSADPGDQPGIEIECRGRTEFLVAGATVRFGAVAAGRSPTVEPDRSRAGSD